MAKNGGGNVFNEIQVPKPQYSWFDLTHDHKTTFNMGELIPVLVQECLPSDKFQINSEAMFRMMPMVAPIMHKVDIFLHHFFVPNRIMWANWERFISPPREQDVALPPVVPTMNTAGDLMNISTKSLADYLGVPIGDWSGHIEDTLQVSALPFCAYQMIWFEYYRDQNLQLTDYAEFRDFLPMPDGFQTNQQTADLSTLRHRAWEHDYFTSALPWAQKGAAVMIPIEVSADVNVPVVYRNPSSNAQRLVKSTDGTNVPVVSPTNAQYDTFTDGTGTHTVFRDPSGTDTFGTNIDPNGTLYADGELDEFTTSTTINDLRAAYALQKWLEKNARAGTRYTEGLLVHFGVRSSDARLQRPEYLGGSRSVMAISEVLQTSGSTDDGTPQGNMSGHGASMLGSGSVSYYCEEHGFIMSLLSIRPKTAYHQGLPKLFTRTDRYMYAWPEFAQLGEDVVKNQEVALTGFDAYNQGTFGYLPRYSEYRYNPSRVSGDFHDTLDYWHLARTFDLTGVPSTYPALNSDFVTCTPSSRIFAVDPTITGASSIIGHIYHQMSARRPLPRYGTPSGMV